MLDVIEDIKNEFKIKVTEKLEKEVVAFLNTQGGNLYIGINDNGKIIGINENIDELQRKIKDCIKNNIRPSALGLFDVVVEGVEDEKRFIKIIIARENEKPYYIKEFGRTPNGCFFRIGSAIQQMPENIIDYEYGIRVRNSLKKMVSPEQNLTFSQLKIYYEEKGYKIHSNFLKQLNLFTEDGKYNYVAYLLADNNNVPIQFGKYEGTTSYNLIENENYGYCSLIKATKGLLAKFEIENKIYTKITYPERKEIKLFDYDCIREAVINAIIHNEWTREFSPKFEMFSDRILISSHGGLQDGVSEENFFKGESLPKNPELMRVFKDLGLVEQMGTGITRILKSYDKTSFDFSRIFIRVTFPFQNNKFLNKKQDLSFPTIPQLTETQYMIISIMKENSKVTQLQLSKLLDISISTVKRNLKELMDRNIIARVGATKNGNWIINKEE